ncbi:IS110 family transposase [Sphingobacterium sp. CZ-2]|uniref:IS110 family transposase n=5 Tax=unclassified Sphingobacterium TaxID=2609468 RepID=UPI00106F32E5|nr:IS110 family transposase [Sphingobacterium sp. CZ-2]QBR10770.1 IS110 family transposase [Sphingobacterium sp. CZ-2]
MKIIHDHAAGIDIGSRRIFISVQGQEVVSFATFTRNFREALDYLLSHGVDTVAMEATGSYWFILYDILHAGGLDVWLVDGRQTKQVPGRKTDVKDCQWIQQLHSYGLLNRCFVAEGDQKEIRSYLRLREDLLRNAAMHVNHMQKALVEMNIRLPEVLSQIHGASGMAVIGAILSGERDPGVLLSLCHTRLRRTKSQEILAALEGFYTERGVFALRIAHEAYLFYMKQIAECDHKLEALLQKGGDGGKGTQSGPRKPIRHNRPDIRDLGAHLLDLFQGRDATILPGITDYTWMQIYSETGNDLERWATEKHFTSWLGLSPGQNSSGTSSRRVKRKGKPLTGQIFRVIAQGLLQSKKIAIGEFGRRLRARKGPMIAIKAMANKLAAQYWRLMVKGTTYVEQGVQTYETQLKKQKEKYLNRLALEFDMKLEKIH